MILKRLLTAVILLYPLVIRASNSEMGVWIQICLPTKRVYFDTLELEQVENHPYFTKYSPQELALAPKTIRRVANSSDARVMEDPRVVRSDYIMFGKVIQDTRYQRSYGHGAIFLEGSTISDQPVYGNDYGEYSYPHKKYVAIAVNFPKNEKDLISNVEYWFTLPEIISTDKFTD